MKSIQLFILLLLGCLPASAQEHPFKSVEINGVLIESGEFKNHYKFDLGDFIFFKGVYENNLSFKIHNKTTKDIVYSYKDSISDAMILNPKFFANGDNSIMVIMIEVAAEYSWGQEIVVIKDNVLNYIGYLRYAALGEEYEESIQIIV